MSKKVSSSTKISKKQTREMIFEKLAAALAEYKNTMKEKKFVSNLKKASKLFADDINKKSKKSDTRKPAKKTDNPVAEVI
jgi:hypothetical protein